MKRVQMHEGNCLREKNITHIQKKKKLKLCLEVIIPIDNWLAWIPKNWDFWRPS